MSIPMRQLEVGMAIWSIMPTFFAATLSAGFGIRAAYLVQGVAMLLAVAGVAWVWRRQTGLAIRGAVLVLGTFLFTPYAHGLRSCHPGPAALLALGGRPHPRQTAGRIAPPVCWLAYAFGRADLVGLDKYL